MLQILIACQLRNTTLSRMIIEKYRASAFSADVMRVAIATRESVTFNKYKHNTASSVFAYSQFIHRISENITTITTISQTVYTTHCPNKIVPSVLLRTIQPQQKLAPLQNHIYIEAIITLSNQKSNTSRTLPISVFVRCAATHAYYVIIYLRYTLIAARA